MKTFAFALAFSALSLSVFAGTGPSTSSSFSKSTRIPHFAVAESERKLKTIRRGSEALVN